MWSNEKCWNDTSIGGREKKDRKKFQNELAD